MHRLATALLFAACLPTQAATVSSYASVASWQAATSGPVLSQDFSTYAVGTPMTDVSFLPGVSVSSNLGATRVFSESRRELFAVSVGSREAGDGYYQIDYAIGYHAIAFDITAFEADPSEPSTAQGPGLLEISFADGSMLSREVFGNPSSTPVFIGLISDSAFTSIRWLEGHEGSGGNEETGLDNFRVANAANRVPVPGSLLLALPALALLRRFKRAG